MAAQDKENGLLFSFRFGLQGLADDSGDGVVGLRRGNDALGAGKLNAGGEGVQLLH